MLRKILPTLKEVLTLTFLLLGRSRGPRQVSEEKDAFLQNFNPVNISMIRNDCDKGEFLHISRDFTQ